MTKPVGGRGKKAPYETTVIRVPLPMVPQVEQMIEDYRNLVVNNQESEFTDNQKIAASFTLVSYSEALQRAKEILKSRKSAADSLVKLLQLLYGGTVSKTDLRE